MARGSSSLSLSERNARTIHSYTLCMYMYKLCGGHRRCDERGTPVRSDSSRGIVETRVIIDEICNLDRVEEVGFALARLSICRGLMSFKIVSLFLQTASEEIKFVKMF